MAKRWRDEEAWGSPRQSRRHRKWPMITGAVVLYALGVVTGSILALGNGSAGNTGNAVQYPSSTLPGSANGSAGTGSGAVASGSGSTLSALPPEFDSTLITRIYKSAVPSVVTITAVTNSKANGPGEDIGTGFFINGKGDIATNNHVVSGHKTVEVTLGTKNYTGVVLGTDPLDDLAVVHITASPAASPLPLGTAKDLQPGDLVVAIGNPFQLTASVSAGIVSGINRSMPMPTGGVMGGLIQTDAALNPGNSGGPLLNAQGQVVGIDTAIESPVEGSVGVGFAIPIDRLVRLLPDLLKGTPITHPWLGISGLDINPAVAQAYHLPVSQGVLVMALVPGGPAANAGLQGDTSHTATPAGDGDIITAVDGHAVADVASLTAAITNDPVGTVVHLSVIHHGQTKTVNVTLGAWPKNLSQESNGSTP
ncbi:PDZ domain-containing protein [Alicyclobacillaceae bacterium I2511]|nr:PDZ domain-containing protein [Alicyclobacillaceae bacterium I2511]